MHPRKEEGMEQEGTGSVPPAPRDHWFLPLSSPQPYPPC
jgi:hypothetical protein